MAVMIDSERAAACSTYMQNKSALRELLPGITKSDLRAAVNAIDVWIDDNTAAFNAAIPLPVRTALNTQQKAELFNIILRRRVHGA